MTGDRTRTRPPVILVVDEAPGVLRLVRYLLVTSGYGCLTAATADEAVKMATDAAEPVDLLLVDLGLEGTSARELADRVRSVSPKTRVLYMPKPLAAGYLMNAVRDTLSGRTS